MKIIVLTLMALGLSLAGQPVEAQINCEAGVVFYANGGIKSCVLTGHHQVYTLQGDRLICAHGKIMEQHADGKLKSCTLKEARDFGAQQCPAGAKVEFDGEGRLLACRSS